MRLLLSFLRALMAAALAIVATLTTATLIAAIGAPRDGLVNFAIFCLWLIVTLRAVKRLWSAER